jgi:hypothetical protein
MAKKYLIQPILWLVRDEAGVKFHVKSDDYFGTIATVLSLLEDEIKKDGIKNPVILRRALKNLTKDLLFLQKYYQINQRFAPKNLSGTEKIYINPKSQNKKSRPKGELKSQ